MTIFLPIITVLLSQAVLAVDHTLIGSFEASSFPETDGWERITACMPERDLVKGLLIQHIDPPGNCKKPEVRDQDFYSMSLTEFEGTEEFVVEWRMSTNGKKSEIVGVAPAALVAGSLGITNYHFTIANDQVRFIRDNLLPIVFVDVDPDILHTYRLELYSDNEYIWYIDGVIVDSGKPEGAFPSFFPSLTWGAQSWQLGNDTRWDYIRFGVIPEDGSGDFDSDTAVTLDDFYFFHECLTNQRLGINGGPGKDAGPGCRFADFDFDDDVDLLDFAEFQVHFAASE